MAEHADTGKAKPVAKLFVQCCVRGMASPRLFRQLLCKYPVNVFIAICCACAERCAHLLKLPFCLPDFPNQTGGERTAWNPPATWPVRRYTDCSMLSFVYAFLLMYIASLWFTISCRGWQSKHVACDCFPDARCLLSSVRIFRNKCLRASQRGCSTSALCGCYPSRATVGARHGVEERERAQILIYARKGDLCVSLVFLCVCVI